MSQVRIMKFPTFLRQIKKMTQELPLISTGNTATSKIFLARI